MRRYPHMVAVAAASIAAAGMYATPPSEARTPEPEPQPEPKKSAHKHSREIVRRLRQQAKRTRDSGSDAKREDPSGAEAEGSQSGPKGIAQPHSGGQL